MTSLANSKLCNELILCKHFSFQPFRIDHNPLSYHLVLQHFSSARLIAVILTNAVAVSCEMLLGC